MSKKFTLIAVILLTANLMFAQIINIPADYPTIQQGIDAASDGDTVLVQPGLYVENLVINNQGITLASLFLTTGDTSYISQTVIDGGQDSSVISIEEYLSIIDIEIKGFTIQHGTGHQIYNGDFYGGGISILDWSPNYPEPNNIILSNLLICDNFAANKGGGVYIGCSMSHDSISNVSIKDVIIRNNYISAGNGGGIYCQNFNPVLEDVVIEENVITWNDHAGIGGYFYQSKPRLQNVRVMSNTGGSSKSIKWQGGSDALVFDHASPLLENVLIVDNRGDGISLMNSEAVIHNSTLTYNSGSAIDCDSSSVTLINSIFWGNNYSPYGPPWQVYLYDISTCSISYCDIQDGLDGIFQYNSTLNWLEGNISDHPLFENTGDSTCQLSSVSPCIDAGIPDTNGLNLPMQDLLGNTRIWDGDGNGIAIVDMGAYEYNSLPVGMNEPGVQSSAFVVRSFPNPCSENCLIEFELAKSTRVSIQIYNNMGELLAEPRNQFYSIGQHQVNLNIIELREGIYFFRVKIGNEAVTKKIIKP